MLFSATYLDYQQLFIEREHPTIPSSSNKSQVEQGNITSLLLLLLLPLVLQLLWNASGL